MKMKACSKNQKPLALLALGAVDEQEAEVLRAHLRTCGGCREYWQEVSNVAENLSAAGLSPEVESSEVFHRKVAARIKREQPVSQLENVLALFRELFTSWRVALSVLGAVCIVVTLLMAPHHHGISPTIPSHKPGTEVSSETNLAPSLANYQLAANQSLEQLDRLLTSQANQAHRSLPLYTASSSMAAGGE
jgi:hypothetical protein